MLAQGAGLSLTPALSPEVKYSLSSCVSGGERENRFGCPGFSGHKIFKPFYCGTWRNIHSTISA